MGTYRVFFVSELVISQTNFQQFVSHEKLFKKYKCMYKMIITVMWRFFVLSYTTAGYKSR